MNKKDVRAVHPSSLILHPTRLLFLRIRRLRAETLVLYHFANGRRSLQRINSKLISLEPCIRPGLVQPIRLAATPISETEFDELSALRKAQAWGAPLFQCGHAKYQQTIARLRELEAKERAAG
jgi:hypothetical protein